MATIAFVTEEGAAHQAPYREAINSIAGIDRALLMDPGGTTLEESRRACGAKVQAAETSVEALLRHGAPDLAIVSMIGAHAPAVIEPLLEAGVHVMAEKPSCVHPDQFERLVEVAERRGVHLMMAFAQRRDPVKVDAQRIIAEGGIGSLYAVQASQVSDQARIPGKVATNDWTFRKALAGGGHLTWLGIHALDLIRYLTGAEIEAVQAMAPVVGGQPIDVEDLALVNFRFAGGAHGSLFSGYLMEQKAGTRHHHRVRRRRLAAHQRRRAGAARMDRHRPAHPRGELRGPGRRLHALGGVCAAGVRRRGGAAGHRARRAGRTAHHPRRLPLGRRGTHRRTSHVIRRATRATLFGP